MLSLVSPKASVNPLIPRTLQILLQPASYDYTKNLLQYKIETKMICVLHSEYLIFCYTLITKIGGYLVKRAIYWQIYIIPTGDHLIN